MRITRRFKEVLLYNAIGGRGCGKTDYGLQIAIKLYQCYGCATTWIRHKDKELTDEGNYRGFLNDPKHFGWCPEEWIVKADGVYTGKDGEQLIIFKSVNTFSNARGAGHPNVLFAVFDEMLPEDGKYRPSPKMCVRGLLSLMETMTRGRDGSLLLVMSNYVTARNPYWAKLEIYNDPRYDVTLFEDKAVAIEVCRGYKFVLRPDSKLAKLKRAAKMPEYEDEKADPLLGLVEKIPNGAKPIDSFIYTDGMYCREFVHNGISYWMQHKGQIRDSDIVYSPDISECTKGIQALPKWFYKYLTERMETNLLRFSNPNVMFKILNIIYDAV